MTTIPSRLSRISSTSGSWVIARSRARSLYRAWYRAAPDIVELYAANFPASAIRAKVRQEYERNLLVDDLETVDILLLKGHQEFQEVSSRVLFFPLFVCLRLVRERELTWWAWVWWPDGQLLEDG